MRRLQKTIRIPVEFAGVGLHNGQKCSALIKPAPADNGIVFLRVDLPDAPSIPATADYIAPSNRRTTLRNGVAEIDTVEHFLAACHGLGLDNAVIEVNGGEMPSMDGSARPIVDVLLAAGLVEQRKAKKRFRIEEPIHVHEQDVSLVALPTDDEGLTIQYTFSYPGYDPRTINYRVDANDFRDIIAPARTFVMKEEVAPLLHSGLGKGANAENTVVVGEHTEKGLRFADEYARHKVLDLIGDLFLIGADLQAHLIATKSGHSTNAKLVRSVVEEMHALEDRGEIAVDSGLDIRQVMDILPHRYPFLLIDRVIEIEGFRKASAIKNVSINEPFFQGHFPKTPVMPGVLILESMAQLAGVLMLRKLANTGKLAVLWAIDKVRMRGTVTPGDQLRIEVETLKEKRDIVQVSGRVKVGGKLVSEALLMFTMIDA